MFAVLRDAVFIYATNVHVNVKDVIIWTYAVVSMRIAFVAPVYLKAAIIALVHVMTVSGLATNAVLDAVIMWINFLTHSQNK